VTVSVSMAMSIRGWCFLKVNLVKFLVLGIVIKITRFIITDLTHGYA